MSGRWTTVAKKPNGRNGRGGRRDPIPDFASAEEDAKFTALKAEIPHLMMPGRIRRIAQKLNIDMLADQMLSDEWVAFQREGWTYDQVVKPDQTGSIPDGEGYDILPLDNTWGDLVLFRKVA